MLREYITKNIEAVPSSSTNIKEELGALKRSAQKLAKKASKVLEEVREEASMMEGKIKVIFVYSILLNIQLYLILGP